jgi:hypothetical protein
MWPMHPELNVTDPADDPMMNPNEALLVEAQVRVVTGSSIWLVRPDTYLRLPRNEGPRRQIDDLDGAARDAEWHEHEGVWVLAHGEVMKLRILPAGRPTGSSGLITGPVVQMTGR